MASATDKEINKALNFATTKYAEAIKRLADEETNMSGALWDDLNTGQWLISTNNKVCIKYNSGQMLMHVNGAFSRPIRVFRIEGSKDFDIKRLATDEEIKTRVTKETKMTQENNDFVFVAKADENPAYAAKRFEKDYYEYVMSKCRYNQSKAACRLSISRGTLRTKLKEHFGEKYIGHRE